VESAVTSISRCFHTAWVESRPSSKPQPAAR